MTEVSPAAFVQNGDYGAKAFRQLNAYMGGVGAGGDIRWPTTLPVIQLPGVVLRPTSMKVTTSGSMTVSVAGGAGLILVTPEADDGAYFVVNNGAKSVSLSAAPGGSNQRIDAIVARVFDTQKGDGSDTFSIAKVDGTAATSPVSPDLTALDSIMLLATVLSNSSGIVSITDYRRVRALDGAPIGSVSDHAASTAPFGYVLCDGSSLARTDYPDLFEVIGTQFGAVDGSHFTVPDLRGRVTVAPDGSAGRLTANDTFGATGGEEKHTLITTELPAHSHGLTVKDNGATGDLSRVLSSSNTGTNTTNTAAVQDAGSDTAHNNMQPYAVLNKIIRAY